MKNENLNQILSLMPPRISSQLSDALRDFDANHICEIRLRLDRPISFSLSGKCIVLDIRCTQSELRGTLLAICDGSPYAFSDSIINGYIPLKNGVRCGVCPEKSAGGGIDIISSICIRLPYRGESPKGLKELLTRENFVVPTLFYSPPGVGKTTLLRFAVKALCSGENPFCGVIIDSRREIFVKSFFADTLTDFLSGYEKGEGIDLALRSLSPDVIFCDEIGLASDTESIILAQNSGVPLIATAHGESFDSIMRRPHIKKLADFGIFTRFIGISRNNGEFIFDIFDKE